MGSSLRRGCLQCSCQRYGLKAAFYYPQSSRNVPCVSVRISLSTIVFTCLPFIGGHIYISKRSESCPSNRSTKSSALANRRDRAKRVQKMAAPVSGHLGRAGSITGRKFAGSVRFDLVAHDRNWLSRYISDGDGGRIHSNAFPWSACRPAYRPLVSEMGADRLGWAYCLLHSRLGTPFLARTRRNLACLRNNVLEVSWRCISKSCDAGNNAANGPQSAKKQGSTAANICQENSFTILHFFPI